MSRLRNIIIGTAVGAGLTFGAGALGYNIDEVNVSNRSQIECDETRETARRRVVGAGGAVGRIYEDQDGNALRREVTDSERISNALWSGGAIGALYTGIAITSGRNNRRREEEVEQDTN